MKLLYDAFTEPEPHYAQIIKADKLKPIEVYPKEENKNPNAIWDVKDAGVTRKGNKVTVKMVLVRRLSRRPSIEVNEGDTVTLPSPTSSRRPTSSTASACSTTTSTSSSIRARPRR